jgi:hypothetical protein
MTDDFDPEERRRGFLELADDLDRWVRACRDAYSDLRDPEIADALEALSRRIRVATGSRDRGDRDDRGDSSPR